MHILSSNLGLITEATCQSQHPASLRHSGLSRRHSQIILPKKSVIAAGAAHLLVMLAAALEQNDRADDAHSSHEHGEHECHRHAAQHLRVALRGNHIQVEVRP